MYQAIPTNGAFFFSVCLRWRSNQDWLKLRCRGFYTCCWNFQPIKIEMWFGVNALLRFGIKLKPHIRHS